jgi:hypothetical protein
MEPSRARPLSAGAGDATLSAAAVAEVAEPGPAGIERVGCDVAIRVLYRGAIALERSRVHVRRA